MPKKLQKIMIIKKIKGKQKNAKLDSCMKIFRNWGNYTRKVPTKVV